jgi:dihydroorotase-like cyclic amidohydrolase
VTPHHLFLTETDVAKLGPKRSRVAPKLNTEADRQALWEKYSVTYNCLFKFFFSMDVIDCFATDHAPHTVEGNALLVNNAEMFIRERQ